ncbi:hypothetical protein AKJ08_2881 [Vulgatibacter incomptus]|uniref:DUF883 domain-containing protein n=2 Tax=Vulgatibacter incomptus TaxID=1391653 RepID=A0A0K1PH95_9BACT|nr:hypothetical protein AKJ08_2881 [Vulgatibacter incomptus]
MRTESFSEGERVSASYESEAEETEEARETKGTEEGEQAEEAHRPVRKRIATVAEARKGEFVTGLEEFASSLDDFSDVLGKRGHESQQRIASGAAEGIRNAAGILRKRSASEVIEDLSESVKAHPGVILGGAFALGFLGVRLLRS